MPTDRPRPDAQEPPTDSPFRGWGWGWGWAMVAVLVCLLLALMLSAWMLGFGPSEAGATRGAHGGQDPASAPDDADERRTQQVAVAPPGTLQAALGADGRAAGAEPPAFVGTVPDAQAPRGDATQTAPVRRVVPASDRDLREIDVLLPASTPARIPAATLRAVGSDTMLIILSVWGDEFARATPGSGFRLSIDGRGSATAPPALMEGRADLGPMAREMKETELAAFRSRLGHAPTGIRVAADAVAVFVHVDNPLRSLSLSEVDAIFSSTRKRGGTSITTWGDLGLTGHWATAPIYLHGRNARSDAYGLFKELALRKGDFLDTVKQQPGTSSVVRAVAQDIYAIGYSGVGQATAGARAVPLAATDDGVAYGPDIRAIVGGTYPLARFLRIYVNRPPESPLPATVREFLRFTLTREGQTCVLRGGFLPLPADIAATERAQLGD